MKMMTSGSAELAILIVGACLALVYPSRSLAQGLPQPVAVVKAAQGHTNATAESGHKPESLTYGTIVHVGETITTNAHSKVLLKWETGMLTSLGELSSCYLGSEQGESGSVKVLEMVNGILRVTKQGRGGNATPYMVTVPGASIEPEDYDRPVDFTVELYSPTMSIITVVSGPVRITKQNMDQVRETVVSDCQTVFIDKGWLEPHVVSSNSRDISKLVNRTTIPGTIVTNSACPVPTWLF